MKITYRTSAFDKLSTTELYQILKLRNTVFVVEQNCVYLDTDDKDLYSYHLTCLADNKLVGYTRLIPAGISYAEVSIGRVVIASEFRGRKLGIGLMDASIEACRRLFGSSAIRISAQAHLSEFYGSLGFQKIGEPYMEDGIPHIEMIKNE